MKRALSLAALSVVAAGAPALAQQNTQQAVPVHELSSAEVRSTENFGAILGVRHLPGSSVLVNDAGRRRLLMLDSSLTHSTVVIDSAAGSANSYGPFQTPLIPYLGDSSLFVDVSSLSLLVIDGKGKVARVMAAPRPSDLRALIGGSSGVDNQGRLLYRAPMVARVNGPAPGAAPGNAGFTMPQAPDSATIVRADFETRAVDSVGKVKVQNGTRVGMTQGANGSMKVKRTINPLTTVDDWAVLTDGSIAFVRGHDYHVDLIHPDGSTSSSAKLPFDWKRLTDDDKQKLIDSARTADEAASAKAAADAKNGVKGANDAAMVAEIGKMAAMGGGGAVMGGGGGGQMVVVTRGGDGGGGGAAMGAPVMIGGSGGAMGMTSETEYVPITEIADYYPAIRPNAARADMDGNLWILPTTSAQSKAGELVYDVVNNKGVLAERVRIPQGRSVVGFGKGGIVYLMSGSRADGFYLERARIIGGGKRVSQ